MSFIQNLNKIYYILKMVNFENIIQAIFSMAGPRPKDGAYQSGQHMYNLALVACRARGRAGRAARRDLLQTSSWRGKTSRVVT